MLDSSLLLCEGHIYYGNFFVVVGYRFLVLSSGAGNVVSQSEVPALITSLFFIRWINSIFRLKIIS